MRFTLETRRKTIHILEGIFAAILVYTDFYPVLILLLIIFSVIVMSVLSLWHDFRLTSFFLQKFGRGSEDRVFPAQGTITLFTGILLAAILFAKPVALASITVVTLGDSLNAIIGQYPGEVRNPLNPDRNVGGFLSGFVASAIVASFFISLPAAFLVSLTGMIVEALNLRIGEYGIDDNITIPIVVGASYYVLQPVIHTL